METAKSHKGEDVNKRMHPIGTSRVLLDGIAMYEYAAKSNEPTRMFQTFLQSPARIGDFAFPDILVVIQDTEFDAGGALPYATMVGYGGGIVWDSTHSTSCPLTW